MPAYDPSPYQQAVFDAVEHGKDSLLIEAVAGSGKCLGYDTPVLMFDGTIKMVQDVVPGDQVMGPDNKPRNVLSTNVGVGGLYRIIPVKGESWICNDVHILTLVDSLSGKIFDIALDKYLEAAGTRMYQNAKLFRVAVDFPDREVKLDPYFAGLWIGDGSKDGPIINNKDKSIHDYCVKYAAEMGLEAKINIYQDKFGNDKCPKIALTGKNHSKKKNPIRDELLNFVVNNEKRIPSEYLINSRSKRLQVLAGLLDADGHLSGKCYEISTKYDGLKDDILYLCRSLGFAAYARKKIKSIKSLGFTGEYWSISISGDTHLIPCKINYKMAGKRFQKKNVLRTGFSIKPVAEGKYYGFTLDGDGRFVLGDFTVTHNTTTIVDSVSLIKPGMKVLFLAFNKRIVDELKLRLPKFVHCATFNSQGYRAWRSYVGRFVQTKGGKTWQLMRELLSEDDMNLYGSFIKRMVSLAKSAGIGGPLLGDDAGNWEALREHHNVYIQSEDANYDYGITLAQIVLRESIRQAKKVVDFDDQLYMPYLRNARFDKYDLVFIDEAQDTNEVQIALLKRMLRPGGRLVAVGDTSQAIYGFRGADHNAMNNIRKAFDCKPLPLSISYRCSKAIVREAQKYNPDIEHFEHAGEGEVATLDNYNATDFRPTDAILCRNNAPLIRMAYGFIRRGIGINMPGRDLGTGLINFIRKLRGNDADDTVVKAGEWLDKESEKLIEKGDEDKIEALADRVECLEVIVDNLDYSNRSVAALIEEIEYLFKESDSPAVTLCSVHKSKGDEWDRVFILDFDELMPSRYARKDWMRVQENNLIYVAITRAKSYLGYISSGCFKDEDSELLGERRRAFRESRSSERKSRKAKPKQARTRSEPKRARKSTAPKPVRKGKVVGGLGLGIILPKP